MRKVVYKLAEVALDKAVPETYTDLNRDQLNRFTDQFASMLVNECCELIAEWKKEPFPFDEDVAIDIIRRHFGV